MAWRVYAAYFLAGAKNSWFIFALLALSFFTAELGFICVDTWLAQWSTDSLDKDTDFYMRWYGIITAMYFVAQLVRSFSLAAFGVEASRRLHCAAWNTAPSSSTPRSQQPHCRVQGSHVKCVA